MLWHAVGSVGKGNHFPSSHVTVSPPGLSTDSLPSAAVGMLALVIDIVAE